MPIELTGGEAIARMISLYNPGPIYGMGGFQLLPFYDAARRLGLKHFLINDERAGIFAADAYAKISGRVGLADATLGPGATNLVTGLVEALNAGTPMVVLVGDSHREHSWKNMTQESRQTEILRPAVKELLRVELVSRIPEFVRRAFAVATSGRPGPVVIDVPEDVAHGVHAFEESDFYAVEANEAIPALRCRPEKAGLEKAAGLVAEARRPIVLAGGGIHLSAACDVLSAFANELNMPVAHTLTGKGAIACSSDLNAGLFGRYDRIANKLIEESDLILVVGCKLGEIATKRFTVPPKGKRIVHIDILPEEFGRTTDCFLPLWGDAGATISELREMLADRTAEIGARQAGYAAEVKKRMEAWRQEVGPRLHSDETPVNMARMLTELNKALPEDGILIADGGFAAHWGGLLFDTKRPGRAFVPDRGFASIGYGLPAAIGARAAAGNRRIVSITGDGGFNMMLGELETARRLELDFTIVVVNNAASGYIKALQHLMYGSEGYHASDLAETNYADIANTMGVKGIRVESPDGLESAIAEALAAKGPVILDVVVTRDPAKMLPGVDNRAVKVKKGDRIA
ncbi:thiamine pyrophosphate-binding protein [Nitratireductor indicus]|uniref:thiamine pyrophosphate-binding protein n=1 Tax=Nitratireductor indicus TaxID=721133 RepID=UPI002875F748|nr:thiamine pyrophosphate-binding protein [Nitratireductor indicus]MDS1135160.1 thiamine pyrophosphate-binding protein [Nitratireductor indicus]